MQEEVDDKTIALIVNGGRITANILKEILTKLVHDLDEKSRIVDSERTTIEKQKKSIKAEKKAGKANRKAAEKTAKTANSSGKRSLKSMMATGSELSNIEITNNNIRSFEKVARKYGIQYSLKKDKSINPPRYLVFFRARDVDVMKAAFKEYTGVTLKRSRKISIRNRLQKAIERSAKHRDLVKTRERTYEPSR